MPRGSFRNLISVLRAVDVDRNDTAKGHKVSDDVSLTYQVDDLTPFTRVFGGAGTVAQAVVISHPIVELEVVSPFGVIITESSQVPPGSGTVRPVHMWTQAAANPINGVEIVPASIQERGPVLCVCRVGTIFTPDIPVPTVLLAGARASFNLYVGPGRFVATANTATNLKMFVSFFWEELNRPFSGRAI